MPTKTLTDRFVAGRPAPANYFDTTIQGLTFRVTPAGSKLWSFVYRVKGAPTSTWMTLGSYPALSLLEARGRAKIHRRDVEDGRDPVAEKKAQAVAALLPAPPVAPVLTCRTYAKTFIQFQKGRKKTWADDEQRLNKYVLPAWGDLAVTDVTRKMIAALLADIAAKGLTVGVNRIQMVISRFFAVAMDQGIRDENPAHKLIQRFDENERERVLTEAEIRQLRGELDERPGDAADVVWLRLLLGQRGGETAGMIWTEIDLEARTWFMGGSRTKNKKAHLLWLPDLALEILQRRWDDPARDPKRVFTAMESRRKGVRKLTEVRELFPDFIWKDLRRTFSTGLGDLGIEDGVIERLLNHAKRGVTRKHYNHAKYLPEKQVALAAWDREITRILKNEPKTSRVIPMSSR